MKKKKILLIIIICVICFSTFLIINKQKKEEKKEPYLVLVDKNYTRYENLNEITKIGGEITSEYFYPTVNVRLNESQVKELKKSKHIREIEKNELIEFRPDGGSVKDLIK
ncbi:hypothetical protein [Neobacillus mesonae]|uniref:hypothetical protein n=1 Tax=Neobacillus mesonae TaxID=1193713 RepID=UPI0008336332|nr:hypothetical protein [Neobacillus mesonae]